jgi:hypothetical protein
MATPTGSISFSHLESEFGRNGSKSLGAYRISQSAGLYSNLPLDSGIPQSGPISFGQLRGKTLNIVVDISGGDENRVNMRSKYDANAGVTVIGGFRSKPADPSGKKIYVSVNKKIGSVSSSIDSVALRTGFWGTSTTLNVLLGSNATIIGSGGKGGDFTASTGIEYGTSVYADTGIHYELRKGSYVGPFWRKASDPGPPEGAVYTSGWYVGNAFTYGFGKINYVWYEARIDWQRTSVSFNAGSGSPGSSALGIDYPTTLTNYGYIQNGFGGGGAGGFRSR